MKKPLFVRKKHIALFTVLILFIIFIIFLVNIKDKKTNSYSHEDFATSDICDETKYSSRELLLMDKYEQKKLVALTFDDGPSKYTNSLLDALKEKNVTATFFILGESANTKSETLKEINSQGHEVAIHSYTHKLFTRLKDEQIEEQVDRTRNIIYYATSKQPTLIRVPYGSLNARVKTVLSKLQLTNVLWSVDSMDWSYKNTDKVTKHVLSKVKGNEIILMHDTYLTSINATSKIIDELQARCYEFATVSEYLHIQELIKDETKEIVTQDVLNILV